MKMDKGGDKGEIERHRQIQEVLTQQPFVTVKDLLDIIDVSPATIRRDIAKLHEAGLIRKVFGGVALPEAASAQRLHAKPFEENRVLNVAAKRAIAEAAQSFYRDGDSLIVHGGTTCFLFAQLLARRNVKVYTNSMPVAATLGESGTCQLTIAGGELYREPGIIFSTSAEEPDVYASKFFLGAQGLGPSGVLESHPLLMRVVSSLAERSDEIIVLADSSKFSIRARHVALPISRIGTLITDDRISQTDFDMMRNEGVDVVIAPTATGQEEE